VDDLHFYGGDDPGSMVTERFRMTAWGYLMADQSPQVRQVFVILLNWGHRPNGRCLGFVRGCIFFS
jgi:hypothetical protein